MDEVDLYGDIDSTKNPDPSKEENFNFYDEIMEEQDYQMEDTNEAEEYTEETEGMKLENASEETQGTPESTTSSDQSNTLQVSNLTWWTTDQELEDRFGEFGKIKGIRFLEEKVSGKSKGVAFIEFSSSQSAALAKEKLQGSIIHERNISISFFQNPPKPPQPRPILQPVPPINSSMGGLMPTPVVPPIVPPPSGLPPLTIARGRARGSTVDPTRKDSSSVPRGRGRGRGFRGGPIYPPSYPFGFPPRGRGGRGAPILPFIDPRLYAQMPVPHFNPAFFGRQPEWKDERGGYYSDEEAENSKYRSDRSPFKDDEKSSSRKEEDSRKDEERSSRKDEESSSRKNEESSSRRDDGRASRRGEERSSRRDDERSRHSSSSRSGRDKEDSHSRDDRYSKDRDDRKKRDREERDRDSRRDERKRKERRRDS